jgi:hypothetical protein
MTELTEQYARQSLATDIVAASSMAAATSPGCESSDMWLDRRMVFLAFVHSAEAAWSSAIRIADPFSAARGHPFRR